MRVHWLYKWQNENLKHFMIFMSFLIGIKPEKHFRLTLNIKYSKTQL